MSGRSSGPRSAGSEAKKTRPSQKMSARKQRSYKGRVACREDVIFGECARRTTSRLSKRKEAPHDGLQPSGCDGAMLSEKAQTRQLGFMVNIQRDPTRHATDTSGRRKCFSGDEGRLTSKMPHDGWRHHDTYVGTCVVYLGTDIRTGKFLTRLLGPNE